MAKIYAHLAGATVFAGADCADRLPTSAHSPRHADGRRKGGKLNLVSKFALIVMSLMSVAAGLAKLMQAPQEVSFFAEIGLGVGSLLILGALQVLGGALAFIPKLRLLGLLLVTLGFFVSVLIITMTGNMAFAVFSLLPVIVSIRLVLLERNAVRYE